MYDLHMPKELCQDKKKEKRGFPRIIKLWEKTALHPVEAEVPNCRSLQEDVL